MISIKFLTCRCECATARWLYSTSKDGQ